jgi:hypothetical protein
MSFQAKLPARARREKMHAGRDALWSALEWLAIPVFILYPQLAVLRWYRYVS